MGSYAVRKFITEQSLSDGDFRDILIDGRIGPLTMDSPSEESRGFCHPHTGMPVDSSLDTNYPNGFIFGFRIDKKKVPSTRVKILAHELQKKDPEVKIAKLKKQAKEFLFLSTEPTTSISKAFWDGKEKALYCLTKSEDVVRSILGRVGVGFIEVVPTTLEMLKSTKNKKEKKLKV